MHLKETRQFFSPLTIFFANGSPPGVGTFAGREEASSIFAKEISMIVTAVMVQVKPDAISAFIEATIKTHEASVKEPGNLRFDVLQDSDDPCRFMLYEAYEGEEVAAAHKSTPQYIEWKRTVEDWMQKPLEVIPYTVIRPFDPVNPKSN
jgi:(4S)-4-hydroxy-5-phosphonooxypentane-2,3-dione isomerase